MADRRIRVGLVGAGMFGGDVHLRAFADLQRSGLAPFLARLGLDEHARPLADIRFELAGLGARTARSAQRAGNEYERLSGRGPAVFHGETPWLDLLAGGELDILAVATPDNLHTEPVLAALDAGCDVIVEKPMCLDTAEADRI